MQNLGLEIEIGTKDLSLITDLIRQADNKNHILDAFSKEQLLSKTWLIEELLAYLKPKTELEKLVILGGWFGTLSLLLNNIPSLKIKEITNIDINKSLEWKANLLLSNYNNFRHKTCNMLDYTFDGKEDIIICTSCEHITKKELNKLVSNLPLNVLLVLQSNNFFNLEEHVNCVNDVKEFENQLGLELNVIKSLTLNVGFYNRFMIFAKKIKNSNIEF